MRILVLGGTAWLGRTVAETARDLGHEVTCLARGTASFPTGVAAVRGDRTQPGAYAGLGEYDRVVDVARQPGQVRSAVAALAGRCGRYVFVSTGNVYADHSAVGGTEDQALLEPLEGDTMSSMEVYGEAKVAGEVAVAQGFPASHVLARAGLIGGPGDASGRSAYWPWRFAHPSNGDGRVLVLDEPAYPTQVIDVRDLAAWLVTTDGLGAYNLVGEVLPLGRHLEIARAVAGHTGPLAPASSAWLTEHDVESWMGPRSLPLWVDDPAWVGFTSRSNARARAAGLTLRPLAETLRDTLAWAEAADRDWAAGLSDDDERELLAALG